MGPKGNYSAKGTKGKCKGTNGKWRYVISKARLKCATYPQYKYSRCGNFF